MNFQPLPSSMDKMYRQVSGHATGQKQAPSVACQGAGRVERRALNKPREIVYNTHSDRVLSKDKDDPMFLVTKRPVRVVQVIYR